MKNIIEKTDRIHREGYYNNREYVHICRLLGNLRASIEIITGSYKELQKIGFTERDIAISINQLKQNIKDKL